MTKCNDPKFKTWLYAYEIGALSDEQRHEMELHLMNCPACLEDAVSFKKEAKGLRLDKNIREELTRLAEIEKTHPDKDQSPKSKPVSIKRFLRVGLAAAAVLAILLLKPWHLDFQFDQTAMAIEDRLLVMPFEDLSASDDSIHLGRAVASLLITDLSQSHFVSVVSSQRINDIKLWLGTKGIDSTASDFTASIAKRASARWVLHGTIMRDGRSRVLTSELLEYPAGIVVATQRVTGSSESEIFQLVDQLTPKIKNDLSLPEAALSEPDIHVADITTRSQEAYLLYLEGLDYVSKAYLTEAIRSFESCLEHDSTFAMAYYHLAAYKNRKLIEKAVQYGQNATRKELLYIRSREADLKGELQLAIVLLEELLESFPDEKDAFVQLSLLEYYNRNYEHSLSLLNEALRIDPIDKRALTYLAYVYDALGNLEGAVEAIARYIPLAPNEANPYDTRGDIYAHHGRLRDAIDSYNKALEKKSDFDVSRAKLGHMYLFLNEFDHALEQYRYLEQNGTPSLTVSARIYQVYPLILEGRLREAIYALDSALLGSRAEPEIGEKFERATFPYLKALLYDELGETDSALFNANEAFRIFSKQRPGNLAAYAYSQAEYHAKLGQLAEADSIATLISDFYERIGDKPESYIRAKGLIAYATGDFDQAVTLFEELVAHKLPSQDFQGNFHLGQAYIATEQFDQARQIFERIMPVFTPTRISEGVKNVKLHYYYGIALEETGNQTEAIEQYDIFLSMWQEQNSELESVKDAVDRLIRLKSRI